MASHKPPLDTWHLYLVYSEPEGLRYLGIKGKAKSGEYIQAQSSKFWYLVDEEGRWTEPTLIEDLPPRLRVLALLQGIPL